MALMKCPRPSLPAVSLLVVLTTMTSACSGWRLKGGASSAEAAEQTQREIAWPQGKAGLVAEQTDDPGAVFLLDGEPMCFHGSNNYYLAFKSEAMVDSVFENSKKIGLQVFRHWGFTDRGSLDGSIPHVDGDGTKEGVYFQYWDTQLGRPAYNDGPDGLQRLDLMMAKAREHGIRMVLVFVNNWYHFGGMDQYLEWFGLKKHPQFYTDERVKKAYKDWVGHLMNRTNSITGVVYKDDPTLFAWQLANEPRVRNYTKYDSPGEGYDQTTITAWATEMAQYVRSIDPHHLISVGDEGFFWHDGGKDDFYRGADGVDHDALLRIPDVDYGTFHLYPDHWGVGTTWGDQWIVDHIAAARAAGKPTVLEEYGIVVTRDAQTDAIIKGGERRHDAYRRWNDLLLLGGGAGSMYWMQAGYDDYVKKNYKDYDHFTVYSPDTDPTAQLIQSYAQRFPTDARLCQLARRWQPVPKRRVPEGFVTVSLPPPEGLVLPDEAAPSNTATPAVPPSSATPPVETR